VHQEKEGREAVLGVVLARLEVDRSGGSTAMSSQQWSLPLVEKNHEEGKTAARERELGFVRWGAAPAAYNGGSSSYGAASGGGEGIERRAEAGMSLSLSFLEDDEGRGGVKGYGPGGGTWAGPFR
jgi:hypothetical protein